MREECNSCLHQNTKYCRSCNGTCPFTEYDFEKILNVRGYIWVITLYTDVNDVMHEVCFTSIPIDLPSHFIKETGKKFGLYLGNELKAIGYIMGTFNGYEPLHHFGYEHDCDRIEYLKEED
jgi:hypothetical protein